MILVMAVMLALYFLGVGVSWIALRKRKRRWQRRRRGLDEGDFRNLEQWRWLRWCALRLPDARQRRCGKGREADNTADHEHGCGDTAADCHGCAATGKKRVDSTARLRSIHVAKMVSFGPAAGPQGRRPLRRRRLHSVATADFRMHRRNGCVYGEHSCGPVPMRNIIVRFRATGLA